MNLVLADTEEFRRIKRRQNRPSAPGASSGAQLVESEEKRTLGLTIVRGAHIISLSVESPPPADPSARLNKSAPGGIGSTLTAGSGVAKAAGRGAAPPSLAVGDSNLAIGSSLTLIPRALLLALAATLPLASPVSLEVLASLVAPLVEVCIDSPGPPSTSRTISQALLPALVAATFLQAALAASPVLLLASTQTALRPRASTLPLDDNDFTRRKIVQGLLYV
jgi:small nuclear ribonucleoprotein (snRNP)-like protein